MGTTIAILFTASDPEFFDRLLYLRDRLVECSTDVIAAESDNRPVVYLAEAPEHLRGEYMELRQKLEGVGDRAVRIVAPDERHAYLEPAEADSKADTVIAECDVIVQLVDTQSIRGIGSFKGGYEDWLANKAAADKPMLRW